MVSDISESILAMIVGVALLTLRIIETCYCRCIAVSCLNKGLVDATQL